MIKSIRNIAVILLFLSFASLSYSAEVIQLSNTPGMAELPFIKVMKTGDIMVIYAEGHHFNADGQLYYRILDIDSGKWSSEAKAVPRRTSSAYAQIVDDATGDLHMAFMDGNASSVRDIWYAKFDIEKYNWKAKQMAYESPGVNSSWPRIQVDKDKQKIYIVWSHNYSENVGVMDLCMIENAFDGIWPVPKGSRLTISDTSQAVSVHGDFKYRDGKVYALWMDDNHKPGNWNMYYNEGTYNETTKAWSFGESKRLFPTDANQYYPALELDDAGNVHILYSHKNNPVYHARKAGGSWSNPKAVSTGATDQNMFAVLKYGGGLLHSVWRQGKNVFYGRALPDGTWVDPVKIADGQAPYYPGIDIDANGDAHVVFSDGDPDHPRNVFYTKVSLPGNAPEAVIKAEPTTGLVPFVVNFDGTGSSDSDGKIIEYRWSFGDGSTAKGPKVAYTYKNAGHFTATLSVIDNDLRAGTDQVEIVASTGHPFATFEVSANQGMRPLTVVFDASASEDIDGEIVSFDWNFGDGSGGNGEIVTHVYETGGIFNAVLTVTDNDGKQSTDSEQITVYQKPEACFTATPTVGKAPLEVSFDASCSFDEDGEIRTYKWDYGDGQIRLSKKTNHTYSTPGRFMVILQVIDNDGITGTTSQEIQVLDAPLPPINVQVEKMTNRTMFYMDYVNKISWEANPDNTDAFNVVQYKIYRRSITDTSDYQNIGEVPSGTFVFDDRGFSDSADADSYEYIVTSVDDAGNESDVPELPSPTASSRSSAFRVNKKVN